MMAGGIYDPVSLVDHAGFGAVKPDNAVETLGGIAVFDGGVRTLTDAQGHAMRFREYLERPGGVSLGLFPIEGNGHGEGLPIVCELKHHADVRAEDRMARFLVEASRALVGGDAEHERRVCSRAQASQYLLIWSPRPLPRQSALTAMASVIHTRSRTTCVASSHPESPKKAASSTAGRTKAPPIRRSSAHSPIRVGLSAPSSSTRGSGSEPFQRCSISSARSDQTSCASASSRTGPPTGSSGATR